MNARGIAAYDPLLRHPPRILYHLSTLDLEYPSTRIRNDRKRQKVQFREASPAMAAREVKIKKSWLTVWPDANLITCDKCKIAEPFPLSLSSAAFNRRFEKFEREHKHD